MEKVILPDSPSFVDLCTLHQHAMRYYRLWIYACNIVLAVATLVFTVFAVSVLVDPRLKLLSGVEFYQPTFLYAYVALLLQCGILQAIGCLGALRLNQKLLNTYWTLLLVLMIGDIIVGLVWAFRLDRIKSTLRPSLRQRLATQYKVDPEFTQVWDWIQSRDMCCGVDSPFDYPQFNESFTRSYEANRNIFHEFTSPLLPATCCTITKWDSEDEDGGGSGEGSGGGAGPSSIAPTHHTNNYGNIFPHFVKTSTNQDVHGGGSASGSASGSGSGGGSSREQQHRHQQHHSRSKSQSSSESEQQQPTYVGRRKNPAIAAAAKKPSSFSSVEFAQFFELPPDSARWLHSDDFNNAKIPLSLPQKTQSSSSSSSVPVPVQAAAVRQMTTTTTTESGSSLSSSSSRNNHNNYLNSICVLPPELIQKLQTEQQQLSAEAAAADENNNQRLNAHSPFTPFYAGTLSSTPSPMPASPTTRRNFYHVHQHHVGCGDKMLEWIDHVTDILFVIGFCIIVFLKGCFLAILRYEIKEMIQKIRLLNGDEAVRTAAMNELLGLTSLYGTDETSQGDEDDGDGNTDGQGLMSGGKSGAGTGGSRGRGRRASGSRGGRGSGDGGPRESSTTTTTTATTTTTVMLSSNENTASGSSSNSNGKGEGLGSKPFVENHIGNKPATAATRKKSSSAMIIEEDFDSARALLEQFKPDADNTNSTFSSSNRDRSGCASAGARGPPQRSNMIPIPVPRNGNNNIQQLQGHHTHAHAHATPPPPPPHRHHGGGSHESSTSIPMVNFTSSTSAAAANRNELSTGSTTTTAIQ